MMCRLSLLVVCSAPLLANAGCASWCKTDPNGWNEVCTWGTVCDCDECYYQPPPAPLPPWGPGGCANSCATDPNPWVTACETNSCAGCLECSYDCVPSNLNKNLLPPNQGGWRGSTLEENSFERMYDDKYGSKLQLYRIFRGPGWSELNDDYLKFVKVRCTLVTLPC